jgi:hypothetical protein
MKSFVLVFIIILSAALSPAQQSDNATVADTNSVATNQVPTSQAPDEVVKKLSDLVHDGKYAESQQLAAGLLLAYPDDQRLIKAKTLLDKLVAASNNRPPTNSVVLPATSGTSEQLTGMVKIDYNALIQRARDAQQTTDLSQQKTLLHQFMADSSQFLQKHPDQMLLWQLRAASALSLDDPVVGCEAGQKLLAAGAADSNDVNLQQLIGKLKNIGWLDMNKQEAQEAQNKIEYNKRFGWVLGTWSVSWSGLGQQGDGGRETFASDLLTFDMRGTTHESGDISWERHYSTSGGGSYVYQSGAFGGSTYYPSGWQPVISCQISEDKRTMTILIPSQYTSRNSKKPWQNPVTLVLTKISDP